MTEAVERNLVKDGEGLPPRTSSGGRFMAHMENLWSATHEAMHRSGLSGGKYGDLIPFTRTPDFAEVVRQVHAEEQKKPLLR